MSRGHVAGALASAALKDLAAVLRSARRPRTYDRRTPMELARDEWLEDIAEARAERGRESTDDEADRAADRYYGGSWQADL